MSGYLYLDDMTSGFARCCKLFTAYYREAADWRGETLAAHYAFTTIYQLPWSPTRAPTSDEQKALDALGKGMDAWRKGGVLHRSQMKQLLSENMAAIDYVHETTGASIWTIHTGPPSRCSKNAPLDVDNLIHVAKAIPDHLLETSGALPRNDETEPPAGHAVKYCIKSRKRWHPDDEGYQEAKFHLWLRLPGQETCAA